MTMALELGARPLTLQELRRVYREPIPVKIHDHAIGAVRESHAATSKLAAGDAAAYGINTGFGLLAQTRIPASQRTLLQRNIILSHSAGVGPLLDDSIVRLMMVLKLASLLQGFSGISEPLARFLERLINSGLNPCVPAQGSVGASGDLAPLAHMSLAVLGLGSVRRHGEIRPAGEALAQEGMTPLELGPKEGLALLNGTQVSTALALAALFELENNFAAAMVSGAMSLDALQGSDVPFDPRIHSLRGHPGQAQVAQIYRELLAGSQIRESHRTCERVQDPYSLRCQPQVMGACLDLIVQSAETLLTEANSVTDNPLIFTQPANGRDTQPATGRDSATSEVLSGGNFHAEPVAFAADILALACAEIGSIAERRIALLVDPKMSGLPAFLALDSGVNSGFMMAQVTAAALVAENRMLCHPASVDSIPTSANQEDHVSMATHGARRLLTMTDNLLNIIAIEFLAACQGIDFRKPLKTSDALQQAHAALRTRVPFAIHDRLLADDIEVTAEVVRTPTIQALAESLLPSFG
jgi:histidine ammonia-lyase